jgi:hypothetical protein
MRLLSLNEYAEISGGEPRGTDENGRCYDGTDIVGAGWGQNTSGGNISASIIYKTNANETYRVIYNADGTKERRAFPAYP